MDREFINASGVPEDLTGGRVIGPGETFLLDDEAMKDEYNQGKIERGRFVQTEKPKNKTKEKDA